MKENKNNNNNQCGGKLTHTQTHSPLTVSSADDWQSFVLQVYFPASLSSTLLMTSLIRRPSCFISYFSPHFRSTLPFLQSTGAPGLDSSPPNTAHCPSFTTRLWMSRLNVTGRAVVGITEKLFDQLLSSHLPCTLSTKQYKSIRLTTHCSF